MWVWGGSAGFLKIIGWEEYTTWGYWNIFPPGIFLGLGVLKHFELENQTKKLCITFLCQNVSNIYKTETFWSRDTSSIQGIQIFVLYQVSMYNICAKLFFIFSDICFGTFAPRK